MKIRVGFSTTDFLHSRAIRYFIDAPISHTYIKFYDGFLGVDWVIHADWVGVVSKLGDIYDQENKIFEEYEFEDLRFKESIKKNLRLLGKKYDWGKIARWAWLIIFKRWIKKKLENPTSLENPKKIWCVDFCIKILEPVISLPYGTMNPKDLREWMMENYQKYGGTRIVYDNK